MHPTDLGVPGRCRPEIKVSYFRAREWLSIVQEVSKLFVIIVLDQGRNHVGNPTPTSWFQGRYEAPGLDMFCQPDLRSQDHRAVPTVSLR
jgi:hypothetical protein